MAVMGRPRKYTSARQLQKAVEGYFNAISRKRQVLNLDGSEAVNDVGEPLTCRQFIRPPTIASMCTHIGIDKMTWVNYSDPKKHPEFEEVTTMAKQIIEGYLSEALVEADRRNINGIMFTLTNNYGWANKSEIEVGAETRKAAQEVKQISLSEKIAAITAAQAMIAASKNGEDAGDGE